METQPSTTTSNPTIIVVGKQKSVGTAFLLAFLLGPLGLLYASVSGGIIMFLAACISMFILPIFGPLLVWIGCLIWAVSAAQSTNKAAAANMRQY